MILRIVLVENTKSKNPFLGFYQDVTDPIIYPYSKGCHWNVDVEALTTSAGLKELKQERVDAGTLMMGVYSLEQPTKE